MCGFGLDDVIDRRDVPALKTHPSVVGPRGDSLFAAGVADMDFRAAPCVRDAILRRAGHGVFGYEAVPDGLLPALTGWLEARHAWSVDTAHLLRAPNVLNSLAMAANLFTEPGEGILIQPPVFFDFADIILENGRRIVENPLLLRNGRYEMDLAGLEERAADPGTRMIFLCNPHNPVGRVWSRAELMSLGEICRRHGVLVVSDEIHGDITFPGHPYTPFASLSDEDARNSVTCLSPAKTFNIAACCSAFTLVPDAGRRAAFAAENSRLTVNKNNAFASVAMEAAYRGGGPWLDAVIGYLQENIALLRERLRSLGGIDLIEPEGTFLVWLDFRGLGLAADELAPFLRDKARWAITRGLAFGPAGAGFGRLNVACPRTRLARALDDLENALAEAER